jgi:hypothetical protein
MEAPQKARMDHHMIYLSDIWYIPERKKISRSKRYSNIHVYSTIIYNSQKVGTTQMSIDA